LIPKFLPADGVTAAAEKGLRHIPLGSTIEAYATLPHKETRLVAVR
jgi:hypothetical protein